MPKKTPQQTAMAKQSSVPAKRPGVRKLQDLEDLRRLQSKLLKAFLAGEIDEKTYRAAVYGCSVLAGTMRELKPQEQGISGNVFEQMAGLTLVGTVMLGRGGDDQQTDNKNENEV